jgi:hypothetical protein
MKSHFHGAALAFKDTIDSHWRASTGKQYGKHFGCVLRRPSDAPVTPAARSTRMGVRAIGPLTSLGVAAQQSVMRTLKNPSCRDRNANIRADSVLARPERR